MDFYKNKRVVVTGAASGIGAELLKALVSAGAQCTAVDVDTAGLEKLCQNLPAPVHIRPVDLSVPEQRQQLMESLGPVDVFFANAGFAGYGPFAQTTAPQLNALTQVNWLAPMEALLYLNQHNPQPFSFVCTASAMSFVGIPQYALYSGLKAALHGFADTYRFEHPEKVRLSLLYPVATRTAFFQSRADGQKIPWPSQTPAQVAKRALRGVARGQREIFPSRLFFVMNSMYFFHRALFGPYRRYYAG